ncbi:MAG: hypothetical protein ACHREM_06225 [Polyangiales bacterium]
MRGLYNVGSPKVGNVQAAPEAEEIRFVCTSLRTKNPAPLCVGHFRSGQTNPDSHARRKVREAGATAIEHDAVEVHEALRADGESQALPFPVLVCFEHEEVCAVDVVENGDGVLSRRVDTYRHPSVEDDLLHY